LRQQSEGQVGSRPPEPDGVEPALVQPCSASFQIVDVCLPSCDGLWLVESAGVRESLPESLQVRLAVHLLGPGRCRAGDGGPGACFRLLQLADRPAERRRRGEGSRHASRVEPAEHIRRPTDHEHLRPTLFPDVVQPLEHPAGSRPDSLVRRERDLALQDIQVLVVHLDPSRAGLVACSDQGADERGMLDHRPNRHLAARLEVDPDPDREPGVAFEQVLPRRRVGVWRRGRCH
jgi:hypothetical protein